VAQAGPHVGPTVLSNYWLTGSQWSGVIAEKDKREVHFLTELASICWSKASQAAIICVAYKKARKLYVWQIFCSLHPNPGLGQR